MVTICLGCGSRREPFSGQVRHSHVFRGHYTFGHEVRSFRPCGSSDKTDEAWVIDQTGGRLREAYEELTSAPYQPIYVEVAGTGGEAPAEGFGADYARSLSVTDLRRAALEGKGCAEELSGFLFRVRGNEPFWNVSIAESGISFSMMDGPRRLEFPYNSAEADVYSSALVTVPHRVEVRLEKRDCADSMSGERFSYTATAVYDGKQLSGCAYEGLPNSGSTAYQVRTVERRLPGCGGDGSAGCSWYRFDYPEFESGALNAVVAEWLQRPVDENREPAEAAELAARWERDYLAFRKQFSDSAQQWFVRRTAAVLYSSKASISISLTEFSDLGGAHPNYTRHYVNLDPATGRRLTLPDALEGTTPEQLARTAEPILRRARNIPGGQSLAEAGFNFPDGAFALNDNFAILAGGLLFYFNDYEIAPHSLGPTELYIPRAALQ
jgi:uncharacterized membrane protein